MHHSETRTWLRAKLPRAFVVTAAFALLFALVPGVAFITIAILVLTGTDLPITIFRDGGVLWALLIIAGMALLFREVRRSGRKR